MKKIFETKTMGLRVLPENDDAMIEDWLLWTKIYTSRIQTAPLYEQLQSLIKESLPGNFSK